MEWVYSIQNNNVWDESGKAESQRILLRPVWYEQGAKYTSGIVDLKIMSIRYLKSIFFKLEEDKRALLSEKIERMGNKKYFIDELDIEPDEREIYLNDAEMYVQNSFNIGQMLNIVKVYLANSRHVCSSLEETDFENFAFDVNPILRMFRIKNAKKYEAELGVEWWKSNREAKSNIKPINNLTENTSGD